MILEICDVRGCRTAIGIREHDGKRWCDDHWVVEERNRERASNARTIEDLTRRLAVVEAERDELREAARKTA